VEKNKRTAPYDGMLEPDSHELCYFCEACQDIDLECLEKVANEVMHAALHELKITNGT